MKCIVIQTSPERISAEPVTNENGTPHIYATISEARAELRANGYSYNRANQRYYIKGTEYRAYIVREDSEEYAEIMEYAEQEAAPEYIEPEHIQTVSGHKIYRSTDPVTGENVFTVAGRDFWELAEARYFAQRNPAEQAEPAKHHDGMNEIERTASGAVSQLLEEYAATIGAASYEIDRDIWQAAYRIAAVEIIPEADRPAGYATATDDDRATVSAMVEAIADAAREAAAAKANQAANDAITDANRAYSEMENRSDNENWQGWAAQFIAQAEQSAAEAARFAVVANNKTITAKAGAVSAMTRRVREEIAAADPEDLEEPAPIYQRYELLAYLGDPDAYDVDAIEAEATAFTADGARVWSAFGEDLAAIAERHQLVTYWPAI